jgi:hypothetical protein
VLAIAAVIAAVVFWRTSEYFSHRRLAEGKIGKVRLVHVNPEDAPHESLAVLDFTLTNDTNHEIVVRSLQPSFDARDGSSVDGNMVAARDIDNIFRNYPDLGEQYNPPLKAQDVLPPNGSIDREVVVRFDAPQDTFAGRKGVVLRVDTIGGIVAELKGK